MTNNEFILCLNKNFGTSVSDCLKYPVDYVKVLSLKTRVVTESDKFFYWCKHGAEPAWEDIEGLIRDEEILERTEKAIEELANAFTSR